MKAKAKPKPKRDKPRGKLAAWLYERSPAAKREKFAADARMISAQAKRIQELQAQLSASENERDLAVNHALAMRDAVHRHVTRIKQAVDELSAVD